MVKPEIEARMNHYAEDQIEIAILSLVKDPLLSLIPNLVAMDDALHANAARLDQLSSDWRVDSTSAMTALEGSMNHLVASARLRCNLKDLASETSYMHLAGEGDLSQLLQCRQRILQERETLKLDVKEELQLMEEDEAKAASRRRDHGTKMQAFARLVEIKKGS